MTKAIKKLSFSLLALALFSLLALPHGASGDSDFTVRWKSLGDGEYTLSVEGLDGTYNIYAVQLELVFTGEYPDARLTPGPAVYTPESAAATVNKDRKETSLNIYLSSLSPINDGAALTLGTLSSGTSSGMVMPARAMLTMLGADLSPVSGADGSKVSVRSASGGSSSSGGTRSSVSVGSAEHGTVKSSLLSAASGARVQLTATPESGYELASLSVTDAGGNRLSLTPERGGVYSFSMPDSAVTVSAQFVRQGSDSAAAALPFSDVGESDWYYGAVKFVYDNGMMNGTDGASFSPALTTSRAMIVTILHRLEDDPAQASSDFTDVPSGMWYTGAVGWASAKGIVGGFGDGRFGPDEAITREQLALILYRYAAVKGLNVSASDTLSGFNDSGAVNGYALDAVRWAVGSGLISGKGDGVLDPRGSATRAEAAAILMRFCRMS